MYAGSLGSVARVALTRAVPVCSASSSSCSPPWRPCSRRRPPTSAKRCANCPAQAVAFEWKLDGARIQVHKRGPEVRIYTRALNEVTEAVPEIVEMARALAPAELILDGEAIALDAADRPRPFQITMRRFGRKLDIEALRAEIPLRAFFFDCLRLEARTLADRPTQERFAALAGRPCRKSRACRGWSPRPKRRPAPSISEALAAGHEGVMAKALAAPYEAGSRGASWLKIKRAHTLDLVVLAAEWGHGRRSGKLSNLHLGALEPATGAYVMLGKTFKGLTDELLQWQTAQLLAREQRRDAVDGVRASGTGRGDRLQRSAGEPPLSRGSCAAAGAREALPHRQIRRRGRHDGSGAPDLRRPVGHCARGLNAVSYSSCALAPWPHGDAPRTDRSRSPVCGW